MAKIPKIHHPLWRTTHLLPKTVILGTWVALKPKRMFDNTFGKTVETNAYLYINKGKEDVLQL